MPDTMKAPVVFVHGLWLHGSSWQPWVDRFKEASYDATAPGWPGDADTVEETRANADAVADYGVDDVTEHYAEVTDSLPSKPIVIGHSFGGLIVEKLLGDGHAVAGVAIDPAPIKGSCLCRSPHCERPSPPCTTLATSMLPCR